MYVMIMVYIIAFARATVTGCNSFCLQSLRKLSPTKETLQFHISSSLHAADRIWGLTLQPNDQIPSLVDYGWIYDSSSRASTARARGLL